MATKAQVIATRNASADMVGKKFATVGGMHEHMLTNLFVGTTPPEGFVTHLRGVSGATDGPIEVIATCVIFGAGENPSRIVKTGDIEMWFALDNEAGTAYPDADLDFDGYVEGLYEAEVWHHPKPGCTGMTRYESLVESGEPGAVAPNDITYVRINYVITTA